MALKCATLATKHSGHTLFSSHTRDVVLNTGYLVSLFVSCTLLFALIRRAATDSTGTANRRAAAVEFAAVAGCCNAQHREIESRPAIANELNEIRRRGQLGV